MASGLEQSARVSASELAAGILCKPAFGTEAIPIRLFDILAASMINIRMF